MDIKTSIHWARPLKDEVEVVHVINSSHILFKTPPPIFSYFYLFIGRHKLNLIVVYIVTLMAPLDISTWYVK